MSAWSLQLSSSPLLTSQHAKLNSKQKFRPTLFAERDRTSALPITSHSDCKTDYWSGRQAIGSASEPVHAFILNKSGRGIRRDGEHQRPHLHIPGIRWLLLARRGRRCLPTPAMPNAHHGATLFACRGLTVLPHLIPAISDRPV